MDIVPDWMVPTSEVTIAIDLDRVGRRLMRSGHCSVTYTPDGVILTDDAYNQYRYPYKVVRGTDD